MLVAGCSILVEDPVFSGDKDFPIYSDWKYYQFVVRSFSKDYKSGKIPYLSGGTVQRPDILHEVSRNQHPETCCQ